VLYYSIRSKKFQISIRSQINEIDNLTRISDQDKS